MNFITGLKTMIVGILASVTTTVAPVVPYSHQTIQAKPAIASPAASQSPQVQVPVTTKTINTTVTTSSPLPLDGNHYYYIRGSHSYLGQSIKYFILVPKNGGDFSGSIEGACQATVGGHFAGGDTGKVSGAASGKCHIAFVKYQGQINFKGDLYPESKKIVIELENAHLPPITLNYN